MELEALLFSISVSDSARHSDQFSSIFAYQYLYAFWEKLAEKVSKIDKGGDFLSHFDFFASSPWKSVTNYVLEWIGLNFYDYDGLLPKMTHTKH